MLDAVVALPERVEAMTRDFASLRAELRGGGPALAAANMANLAEQIGDEDKDEEVTTLAGFMRRYDQIWGDGWSPPGSSVGNG